MKLPPLWGSLFPETFKFTCHPRLSSDQALASTALREKRITVTSVALEFQRLRCLGKFRKVSLETIYSPNSLKRERSVHLDAHGTLDSTSLGQSSGEV